MDISALVDLAFTALPQGTKGVGTFSRLVPGVEDFVNGTRAGDVPQAFDAELVMFATKPDDAPAITRNVKERRTLIVQASACTYPVLPDTSVQINGDDWGIDKIDPLAPDGITVVLYTIYVSR